MFSLDLLPQVSASFFLAAFGFTKDPSSAAFKNIWVINGKVESETWKYFGFMIDDSIGLAYAFLYVLPGTTTQYVRVSSNSVPPEVIGKEVDDEVKDRRSWSSGARVPMRWWILIGTFGLMAAFSLVVWTNAERIT